MKRRLRLHPISSHRSTSKRMRQSVRKNMRHATMAAIAAAGLLLTAAHAQGDADPAVLKGKEAFGSWQNDKPGTVRLITPADLPKPGATRSASNGARIVRRPAGAVPQVPPGFKIDLFAEGLGGPRT